MYFIPPYGSRQRSKGGLPVSHWEGIVLRNSQTEDYSLYMTLNQTDIEPKEGTSNSLRDNSWGESEHLTYLEKIPSIFDDEDVRKAGRTNLVCATCRHLITKVSERIDVRGRHDHSFHNLGYPVKLGCFRNAQGCTGVETVSHGYSWFPGYAWQIQVCGSCYIQLGWKYMTRYDSFYGLIFGTLREEESGKDNGVV